MDNLIKMVNSYCNRRQYGKAWKVLQKVNKYPQAGSDEDNIQEMLEKRMAITTKFGVNFAVVLCTLFSIPIFIHLYDTFDFFAIWTNWVMEECDFEVGYVVALSLIQVLFFSMQSRKSVHPCSVIGLHRHKDVSCGEPL